MSEPAENPSDIPLIFTTTEQSMWNSGPALAVNYDVPLVGFSTGKVNLPISIDGTGVDLSGNLNAALVATLQGTAGGVVVSYPVSAGVEMPNTVAPGQQFTIVTSNSGIDGSATIAATLPSFNAALDLNVSGGGSVSGQISAFGLTIPVFSTSGSFSDDVTLASLNSSQLQKTVPIPNGSISFAIPTSDTQTGPTVSSGSPLPSITAAETGNRDVISATTDLAADIAQLLGVSDFPSGSFLDGEVTYDIASADLTGDVEFVQQFTFDPTSIDIKITTPWASETIPLGDKATFTVPTSQTGPFNVTTEYVLTGNLVSQSGIEGNLSVDVSLLSGSIGSDSIKPAYSQTFSIGTGPDYLIEPGGASGFALQGFNTPGQTIAMALGTGTVTVPGGGAVSTSAFSADSSALIQFEITSSSGSALATNIYNGSGIAVPVPGDLNIEVVSAPGTHILPLGFTVGILEPAGGNAELDGNLGDVLLAAAPGAGHSDILRTGNNSDTLVGGQTGRVDFVVSSGFTGEIGGLVQGDTIDLSTVAFNSTGSATLNDSSNMLTVHEGGNSYGIQLDAVQDLSQQVFTLASDGSGGTDVELGIVVSAGHTFVVNSGQVSAGLIAMSGGTVNVESGGTTVSAAISGGLEFVAAGGSASLTTVDKGTYRVNGFSTDAIIGSGVIEQVFAPGQDRRTTVDSGATQQIIGGEAFGATIESGAKQIVSSGGSASATTIDIGATQTVSHGGIVSATQDDGVQSVYGTAIGTDIGINGSETVYSGGVISDTATGAGTLTLMRGASASDLTLQDALTISSGVTVSTLFDAATANIYGSASDILIQSGGTVVVHSGSFVGGPTTVFSGGSETLERGTSASGVQLSGGTLFVVSQAIASGTLDGGIEDDYGTDISGVVQTLASGGLQFGGLLRVYSGAVASDTTIIDGQEVVYAGGSAVNVTDSSGILQLNQGSVVHGSLVITAGATLQINGTTMPTNVISGFDLTDTIDLRSVKTQSGGSVTIGSGGKTLQITEGGHSYDFTLASALPNLSFTGYQLTPDGFGGTEFTGVPSGQLVAAGTDATLYLGTNDTVGGGVDATIYAAAGSLIVGGSSDTIHLSNVDSHTTISDPETSGYKMTDTVVGFTEGIEFLSMTNETPSTISAVIATAHTVSGNTTVTFADHSTITLVGTPHVSAGFF